MNEFNKAPTADSREEMPLSPKIEINERTLKRKSREITKSKEKQEAAMKKFYIQYALHMTIPLYGLFVLILQFI